MVSAAMSASRMAMKARPTLVLIRLRAATVRMTVMSDQKIIEVSVRVEMPGPDRQFRRVEALAAAEKFHPADDPGDRETEPECGNGKVGAFQAEGREAEEKTEEGGNQGGRGKGKDERANATLT